MDLGLKGLNAVLAGATKGIGRATAEVLAAEGCNISVCARDQAGVDETVASLKAKGVKAIGESVEITNAEAYKGWVSRSAEQLGGCDIFICFTSFGGGPPTEERWKGNFELDVLATWRGVEAALPFLEKSKHGSIVVISTTVAVEPSFGPQSYAAMKAAIMNWATAMSQQLGPKGIRVNTVSPGPVFFKDGSWDKIKQARPEFYDATAKKLPLGRLGEGPEVGRAIAFLASPAVPFMTGTNLVVDGGMVKRVQH
jgi:3-oxoacyl-[acyl-carrier protein] reductase